MSWGDDDTVFDVVINHEEQYSIWPSYKAVPAGWTATGMRGKKADCLAHIDEVWTDMRPLSLRLAMARDESVRDRVAPEGTPGSAVAGGVPS